MPGADKETLVYQFTQNRTVHLHQMLDKEYDAMCRQMEDITGYDERRRKQYDLLRKARSGVLHQLQIYGIDTTDWNRVDAFCKDPRIAGKTFRALTVDDLNALNTKIRMIIRKQKQINMVNIKNLSKEERAKLLAELQNEEKQSRIERRETYEGLRAEMMHDVWQRLTRIVTDVRGFHDWLQGEVESFVSVMRDYGQVRKTDQRSYTITDGDFRLEISSNKVKGFDERADLAAERLIDYLKRYMKQSEKGSDDPMYQMAMTLLERNKAGDLDYKSISKLYELEDKFDSEYSEIMTLFKEANVVQKNAINYYFYQKNPKTNVWERVEPSFCRL